MLRRIPRVREPDYNEVEMLPPFIIEQIRKREERQREEQRPVLELPLDEMPPPVGGPSVSPSQEAEQEPKRGVIVVDH